MKILICPDKFKGSLSAKDLCNVIASGLMSATSNLDITSHPLADGGDGSLEVLIDCLGLQKVQTTTLDPLGRKLSSSYYKKEDAAYIEVSTSSGLALLNEDERDPMKTSSYGTGLLIRKAIKHGAKHIYLFIGGSATNDAGIGIASALGFDFLDKNNKALEPIGSELNGISKIVKPIVANFYNVNFTVLCDVVNPLYGPDGAAYTYAKQKGANSSVIEILDKGLRNFASVIQREYEIDLQVIEGGGAAGGIAAGMKVFFNAEIRSGFEMIASITQLESAIINSDLVITGEGSVDEQSLQGKVLSGVARLCKKHTKPLVLIAGRCELGKDQWERIGVAIVYTVLDTAIDLEDAMKNVKKHVQKIASSLIKEYHM